MEGFRARRDVVLFVCPGDPLATVWRMEDGLGRGARWEQLLIIELIRPESGPESRGVEEK